MWFCFQDVLIVFKEYLPVLRSFVFFSEDKTTHTHINISYLTKHSLSKNNRKLMISVKSLKCYLEVEPMGTVEKLKHSTIGIFHYQKTLEMPKEKWATGMGKMSCTYRGSSAITSSC